MDEFKGLYIRPARNEEQTQTGKGGIYGMDLTKSGLVVYGRNRMKAVSYTPIRAHET